jgi:dTDP-4-dehydrorhamnose 3,5-epimerase
MKPERTELGEVILIEPSNIGDDKGYFSETFRKDLFEKFIRYKSEFL